ncbi:hypothetical protein PIIN_02264 [Serendipita indica DSM 11827]|uniref:N-acetyltransferase domain-containing protein n=1 Tax=Serendipita indica (strain DSM 11827) TaxID=1109443 RepID=G4TAQ7_SERID|nr:hypothetical protein PIIN_02264 [Serendipita indica DSM 11827]
MSDLRALRETYTREKLIKVIEILKCGPEEYNKRDHTCKHSDDSPCVDPLECCLFDEYDERFPWKAVLVGYAYYESIETGKRMTVGHFVADIINREKIRDVWYDHMEAVSSVHAVVAETVFDRQGYMHRELYEEEPKMGSGVFKKEIGEGPLILLRFIEVDEKFRRRGIGTKLLSGLHKVAKQEEIEFICTYPKPDTKDTFTAFVRSVGYRRVARSNILAYATDEHHSSRQLAKHLDSKPVTVADRTQLLEYTTPICLVISKYMGNDAIRILQKFPIDTDWNETSIYGITPLHLAASFVAPEVIAFLLSRGKASSSIYQLTHYGNTPLGVLKATGVSVRYSPTSGPVMNLDHWRGHADDYVECYRLLSTAMNMPWDDALEKRVRAGCSCGECLEGVMSPRLQFLYSWCASDGSFLIFLPNIILPIGYIRDSVQVIKGRWGQNTDKESLQAVNSIFGHLPTTLSAVCDLESFQIGFTTLLEYTGAWIEEKMMPNASGLERKIDQYTELGGGDVQTYLELGGTINDALGYLFGECCYKAWSLKFRNLKETKAIPHCR